MCGPELGYAMVQTKRGHTGIMDSRPLGHEYTLL
jgi:hypothetical protein